MVGKKLTGRNSAYIKNKNYSNFNQHFLKINWILLKLIESWIKILFSWNLIRQSASIFVISKTNSDMGALLIPYMFY